MIYISSFSESINVERAAFIDSELEIKYKGGKMRGEISCNQKSGP